jgi:hypothetical protein
MISHYHKGISYDKAFEITPFEKQIISEFIQTDMEREMKFRSAMFGIG